jgi:hypothetical protein
MFTEGREGRKKRVEEFVVGKFGERLKKWKNAGVKELGIAGRKRSDGTLEGVKKKEFVVCGFEMGEEIDWRKRKIRFFVVQHWKGN